MQQPQNDPRQAVGNPVEPEMAPGDVAPAGTPGTGENLCPACSGSGDLNGQPCAHCNGTGKVVEGVGGA
jgi:hypothetical protein